MNIFIIDNYDSFTYNLAHIFRSAGADVTVVRNDKFQLEELEAADKLVLSPGPGIPEEAGLTLEVIDRYKGKKPILGVCLGHQAIGQYFGGQLTNLPQVFHGVQTPVTIAAKDYLFDGLDTDFMVGRYHSWVVDTVGFPLELEATALSGERQIMALRHRKYDIRGVQFHPESVLTPQGELIIRNWINHQNK